MAAEVSPPSADEASSWWSRVVSQQPDANANGTASSSSPPASLTSPASQTSHTSPSISSVPVAIANGTNDSFVTGSVANNAAARVVVAVACVACRSRHLKCDGGSRCSRCVAEGIQCSYVKSRRGWKGPRRSARLAGPQQDIPSGLGLSSRIPFSLPSALDEPLATPLLGRQSHAVRSPGPILHNIDFLRSTEARSQLVTFQSPRPSPVIDSSGNGLVTAFYVFFHPPHPFLVPHFQMLELLQTTRIRHLELALQYIGSFYVPAAPTAQYYESLKQTLAHDGTPRDGTLVQALLLLAIGTHIEDKEAESAKMLEAAIALALDLGMNRRDFAPTHGGGHMLIEESWRRTWWELFVVDGMMCGVNPLYKMALGQVPFDVPLPCDEEDYMSGRIPVIRKFIEDYDDAIFLGEPFVFSSGTYRIDAVRVLHKVMAAGRTEIPDPEALDVADTSLANWALHLPSEKRKPIDRDGQVDEVLFVAHMIVNACTIMLHRPRSDLSYEDVKDVTTCVKGTRSPLPGMYKDLHTAKAMQAAKDISKLARMPSPLIKHTPFFTCAVTMAAVVYLSYWSFIATESGDTVIKEHIRLNIGVLKALAEIWPVAKTVLAQVKGVAQELFASRKALNNAYWNAVTREEILQGMIEGPSTSPHARNGLADFLVLPPV